MKPIVRFNHVISFLILGTIAGIILNWRRGLEKFVSRHPILSLSASFILGGFATGIYLSYLKTTENFKLPPMAAGMVKKWDSPARNLEEVFGKRTRGNIIWEWPSKPVKKAGAKARYDAIWAYHSAHPEATYEQIAELFSVERKTVERAIRSGRTGRLSKG